MRCWSGTGFRYLLGIIQQSRLGTRGYQDDGGLLHVSAEHVSNFPGAFVDQMVGTALLVAMVLAIGDPKNVNPPSWLGPILVGVTVLGIGLAFGSNAGYAINPARDFGPRLLRSWRAGRMSSPHRTGIGGCRLPGRSPAGWLVRSAMTCSSVGIIRSRRVTSSATLARVTPLRASHRIALRGLWCTLDVALTGLSSGRLEISPVRADRVLDNLCTAVTRVTDPHGAPTANLEGLISAAISRSRVTRSPGLFRSKLVNTCCFLASKSPAAKSQDVRQR